MRLSPVEQAALWKCWYAGRYDKLGQGQDRGSPEEWSAASKASFVNTPNAVFERLIRKGLLTRLAPPRAALIRLTDAGRAALATPEHGEEKER